MEKMKKMKRLHKEEEVSMMDQMPQHSDDADADNGRIRMQRLTDQIFGNPVIQENIFSFLPSDPSAVKAASLVCRSWHSLLAKPKYWTWAQAELRREAFIQMFSTRRFKIIGSVVTNWSLTGYQLRALFQGLRDCSLKKISCVWNRFTAVEPAVLAGALVRLEEVDMEKCLLSKEELQALMEAIGEAENLNLKTLRLGPILLVDSVAPELFKHFLRIEDLKIEDLDPIQVKAFYQYFVETKDVKLKKLTFGTNSATFIIDNEFLVKTWPRLESIVVRNDGHIPLIPSVYPEQVRAVFEEIIDRKDFKLKSIQLPTELRAEMPLKLLMETMAKVNVVFSDTDESDEDEDEDEEEI